MEQWVEFPALVALCMVATVVLEVVEVDLITL
jgi:hypothetical protein